MPSPRARPGKPPVNLKLAPAGVAAFSEGDLPTVLERHQGYLVAQPIFALPGSGRAEMHEILLRLTDDAGTEILPRQFLPAAVKLNLMPEIDCLTLHLMEHQLRVHQTQLNTRLAVNISRRSLLYPKYQEMLLGKAWEPLLKHLIIEVKAADIVRDRKALDVLNTLGKRGAGIAINFGEGGPAMVELLHRLGFTILKVDTAELQDFKSHQLIQFTSAYKTAKDFGLTVVFERIESHKDEDFIKPFLPALVQGYLYGKPARASNSAKK